MGRRGGDGWVRSHRHGGVETRFSPYLWEIEDATPCPLRGTYTGDILKGHFEGRNHMMGRNLGH
jgi:hypothetical protein